MEEIIQLTVEDDQVKLPDDVLSSFKNLFSGCRVNFLLGAGFSANLLGILNNDERIFETINNYQPSGEDERNKLIILKAFLYWCFFSRCILPISKKITPYSDELKPYISFGDALYRLLLERGNPALDRQINIFTTNYDPIIELLFDQSNCICNDGFEGRIYPSFSTDNYSKTYYRQAMFSNRKAEIPSVNLVKLHGSVTWQKDIIYGGIEYQNYQQSIKSFAERHKLLFDDDVISTIKSHFTTDNNSTTTEQLSSILKSNVFDDLISKADDYDNFIKYYKMAFVIVNPTKEKFNDTLLNKNYYELLRIFSNEMEKENTLLLSYGFSFKDEHILDLVKRSMINPSLKILIFSYEESEIEEYQQLIGEPKTKNITYICLKGKKFSFEYFNQIMSAIHI